MDPFEGILEPEPEPDEEHEREVQEMFNRLVEDFVRDGPSAQRRWQLEPWQIDFLDALAEGRFRHWMICWPRGKPRPSVLGEIATALRVPPALPMFEASDEHVVRERIAKAHAKGCGVIVVELPRADATRFADLGPDRRVAIADRIIAMTQAQIREHSET